MARMHSRKRGKSGSKKPSKKTVPSWVTYTPKDAELLITKLAKEGKSASAIGLILRDTYGIPHVKSMFGARLGKIMKEKKISPEIPDDLTALIKKSAQLRKHIKANKKDQTSKRGLILTDSKIKRLVKYYKRTGKLSEDWKLDVERIGYYAE